MSVDELTGLMDALKTVSPDEEYSLLCGALERCEYSQEYWDADIERYTRYKATIRLDKDEDVMLWIDEFLGCTTFDWRWLKSMQKRIDLYFFWNISRE